MFEGQSSNVGNICHDALRHFIFSFLRERERINFPSAWLVYYFLCTYSDLAIIPSCQGQNIFGKHLPIRGIFLLNQPSSTNYIVVLLLTEYHSSTWSQSAINCRNCPYKQDSNFLGTTSSAPSKLAAL